MENGLLHIVFDEPQRAVCKGQSVVIYDDDTVLGGGIICQFNKQKTEISSEKFLSFLIYSKGALCH